MPVDLLARGLAARQVRSLASTAAGKGAALVGTASGLAMQTVLDHSLGVSISGVGPGEDAADAIEAAHARARLFGVDVLLPPYTVTLSRPVRVNRLRGIPGFSKIDVSGTTMGIYPLSQFCIVNEHWITTYNRNTADRCSYIGFEILTLPNKRQSLIGLANVSFVDVDQVTFRASRNLDGNGRPYAVDALLDFYASVHGGYVRRSHFHQRTGAYGANRVSAGGGGCIWIRNFSGNGTLPDNVTEQVIIEDCEFHHYTTDECIAIFGVRGTTRNCKVLGNRIFGLEAADLGLPLSESIYRPTLLSIFPLNDGSGPTLGATAAVVGNEFADNQISDRSTLYNVIRIGNTADAAQRNENNATRRNKIDFFFATDANFGAMAVWTAGGAAGASPASANIAIRCIEGTAGVAYSGTLSGNVSQGDEVIVRSGGTITGGFSGWQSLKGCSTRGSLTSAALNCQHIEGGRYEASIRGFVNCGLVSSVTIRINLGGSINAACVIDNVAGGAFAMTGCQVSGLGPLVYIPSTVTGSASVSVTGNIGSVGAQPALNILSPNATIRANGNQISGSNAISAGAGIIKRANNTWGVTDD
ncbi:hypothetical protein [Novosphingobium sp. P6W]|uniref:hypothetical protein n=1 Tax=Novosphingobium sp. P6W TaxID=1609758 RepID=UPI000AFA09A3|nr:hypothetical protein [Novosphingobium sp. P6W]